MAEIYKINHLTYEDNAVKQKIFCFAGENKDVQSIFTDAERDYIEKNNIEIVLINSLIYPDDTIDILKRKIMLYITKISFGEIYLFGIKKTNINTFSLYNELTQNDEIKLGKEGLFQFLQNFIDIDITKLPNKEFYTYDDLLSLNFEQKEQFIKFAIGQKFQMNKSYHYTVNPFDTVIFGELLEKGAEVTTESQNLLFNYGNLLNHTIYLCDANNVLEFAIKKSLSQELSLKVFFPFLYDLKIKSLQNFDKDKGDLRQENNKFLTSAFKNNCEDIDLFYKMFFSKKKELKYDFSGINQINFVIRPEYKINIPLEILFKLFHTNENIPFIKYNPGNRFENIFRLYVDKIAKNGKKIPSLSRRKIFSLRQNLAKHKQVGLYILFQKDSKTYEIECGFEKNGDIHINYEIDDVIAIEEAQEIIKNAINPILNIVGEFLGQSGYSYVMFDNFNNKNIYIKNISFTSCINISKQINLDKFSGCVSSIFNIIQGKLDNGNIQLRYKRTAYFNEMESQDAYITEMFQKEKTHTEIFAGLKDNFQMTDEEAEERLKRWTENVEVEASLHENRKIKIRNNPGFPVFITKKSHERKIIIQINNINNVHYLKILPIYLDTLIRLTQDPYSTEVPKKIINNLCKKSKKETKQIKDIMKDVGDAGPIIIDDEEEDLWGDEYGQENNDGEEEDFENLASENIGNFENLGDGNIVFNDDNGEEEDFENLASGNISFQQGGGGNSNNQSNNQSNTQLEEKIEGKSLSYPNPFQQKLGRIEPLLFTSKAKNKFAAYSRMCPSNVRKQPIILTDDEMATIDREHPGSYSGKLQYGSDPSKKFWYICPRYWCMTGNYSLTEEEVKRGVCGGEAAIIPSGASKVPPGGQIYEFTDKKYHQTKDKKYIEHGPGFLAPGKVNPGFCTPCCFKKWDSKSQKKRRELCQKTKPIEVKKGGIEDYVKGPGKFPLGQGRWGLLPFNVQKMLQSNNTKCFKTSQKKEFKNNHMCLLRQGVEKHQNQSFLACLCDIYSKMAGKPTGTLSMSRFKEIIIGAINLDNFITFQNGTLVKMFAKTEEIKDIEKYKETKIYKLTKNNKYFKTLVSAFINFKKFLRSTDTPIDYEYIWDILSDPNPKLFINGLNIIIFNIPDNDTTDNIEIICPTNHTNIFDDSKPTIFIMSKDGFYEPIYGRTAEKNSTLITPFFLINKTSENIKNSLKFIKNIFSKCHSLPSMPKKYTFIENISFNEMNKNIEKIGFKVKKQVVNFNNKTIGAIVKNAKLTGFIPTKPSSINNKFEYVFMDTDGLWQEYSKTIDFLNEIYDKSLAAGITIPVKPQFKVEEDGLIVGILTMTNQFIALSKPNENFDDGIKTIKGYNYIKTDELSIFDSKIDEDRILVSKKIHLETSFFNIFRNTVRILLQKYKNKKIRKDIENIIKNPYLLYKNKLNQIIKLLEKLINPHVKFIRYDKKILKNIDLLVNCLNLNPEKCASKSFCLAEDSNCKLLLPKNHLISGHDNYEIYLGRMSDQLLRYDQIRLFIFNPRNFISFEKIGYNLGDDEIILLDQILMDGYFDDLVAIPNNPYITTSKTFYNTQPSKHPKYSSVIDMKKERQVEKIPNEICVSKKNVKGNDWKAIFKKTQFQSIVFKDTPICSWKFLAFIMHNFLKKNVEIQEIKQILIDEYQKVNKSKLFQIFKEQGKSTIVYKKKEATLENIIIAENYYVTNVDIFIIMQKFKIPIVFISGRPLKETPFNNRKKIISFLYGKKECFIIRTPPHKINKPVQYSIIVSKNKYYFNLNDLPKVFQKMVSDNNYTFDDYYKKVCTKPIKEISGPIPEKLKQKIII